MDYVSQKLNTLIERIGVACERYPLTIISSLVATVCACGAVMIASGGLTYPGDDYASEVLFSLGLGFMLILGIAIALDLYFLQKPKATQRNFAYIIGYPLLIILSALFVHRATFDGDFSMAFVTVVLMLSAFGYLKAFLAVKQEKASDSRPYWTYWVNFFVYLVLSAILVGLAYSGLAMFYWAADALSIDWLLWEEGLIYSWFVLIGAVLPLFFAHLLSRPQDKQEQKIPQAIFNVVLKYVAIPAMVIYLALIVVYFIDSLVAANPADIVSVTWLIIWFGSIGLATYVAMYALRFVKAERWQERVVQAYGVVFPVLGAVGVYRLGIRIAEYGLTELRFLGVLILLWLMGLALYGLKKPFYAVRVIPKTMAALLAIAIIFMYPLIRYDATYRFLQLTEELGMQNDAGEVTRYEGLGTPAEDIEKATLVNDTVWLYNHRFDSLDGLSRYLAPELQEQANQSSFNDAYYFSELIGTTF